MPAPRQPLFLARESYRKRRLRDGARVLPIFGTVLLMLPLMWPAQPQMVLSHWIFVFVLWLALIALAAILAPGLGESETASAPDAPSAAAQATRSAGPAATAAATAPPDLPRTVQNRP
jgi:hypothetical protein